MEDTDGVDTTSATTVFVTCGWLGLAVGVVIGLLTGVDDTGVTAVLVVGEETTCVTPEEVVLAAGTWVIAVFDWCAVFLCVVTDVDVPAGPEGFFTSGVGVVEPADVVVLLVSVVVDPVVVAVDDPDEEPVESAGAAHATTGIAPTPAPMPSATANAPTRPTYRLCPMTAP